jgi:hypothetical protein
MGHSDGRHINRPEIHLTGAISAATMSLANSKFDDTYLHHDSGHLICRGNLMAERPREIKQANCREFRRSLAIIRTSGISSLSSGYWI